MSTKPKLKVVRSSVAKACNSIFAACALANPDPDEITLLLDSLREKSTRLDAVNAEIETEFTDMEESEIELEFERMEKYSEDISFATSKAKQILASSKTATNRTVNDDCVKLPKLDLPHFSGDVLEWASFDESFLAAVDSRTINNVQKFSYLRAHLKGEALSTVSGLSLTAANYATAYDLLRSRYGNKISQIRAHVRELLYIHTLNIRDVSSLRKFVDTVRLHMRGLDGLGVASDEYEVFLCEILLSRVPHEIKHEFAKLNEDDMTLEKLLRIVENEAKTVAMERLPEKPNAQSGTRKVSCNAVPQTQSHPYNTYTFTNVTTYM